MSKTSFIKQTNLFLINVRGTKTGDEARALHRLSRAVNKLDALWQQASAQFNAGDKHATFNRQTIEAIFSEEND
jgi:hypothetical protein